MTSPHTDVIIVGAGPAGCALALHLARAGIRSLVLDRATFPRDKVCGEGIMPHGVVELDRLGLVEPILELGGRWFRGISYCSGRRSAFGSFPKVGGFSAGLGLRRLHLDPLFHELLRAEPLVTLRTAVTVREIEIGPADVCVTTSAGLASGRLLVGADGLHSLVRHRLGLQLPPSGRLRYGARVHVKLTGDEPEQVEVHLGRSQEFYVTPVGPGVINIALLCGKNETRQISGDLKEWLSRAIATCEPLAALTAGGEWVSEPLMTGPLRQGTADVVADRAVLIGDAAGFLDPITGEGLSLGLLSARLAAEVITPCLSADQLTATSLRPYADRRAQAIRDALRLTELVLWWVRQPLLGPYVVENLRRNPEVFTAILGVIAGDTSLQKIPWKHIRRLALRL